MTDYQLARDRRRREIKTPVCFAQANLIAYAFSIGEKIEHEDPATFKEAYDSKEKELWLEAIREEIRSLRKNKTWQLVDKPQGRKFFAANGFLKGNQESQE